MKPTHSRALLAVQGVTTRQQLKRADRFWRRCEQRTEQQRPHALPLFGEWASAGQPWTPKRGHGTPALVESGLLRVFQALEQAQVRYLVVGGVAVVLHGHPRMTADLDLVIQTTDENLQRAMQALEDLGFLPRAPVALASFADAITRRVWIEEKDFTVFSLWNPDIPLLEVDVFVEEPFAFDEAFERSMKFSVDDVSIDTIGLDDLIHLKSKAGRPKDLEDVRALRSIQRSRQ